MFEECAECAAGKLKPYRVLNKRTLDDDKELLLAELRVDEERQNVFNALTNQMQLQFTEPVRTLRTRVELLGVPVTSKKIWKILQCELFLFEFAWQSPFMFSEVLNGDGDSILNLIPNDVALLCMSVAAGEFLLSKGQHMAVFNKKTNNFDSQEVKFDNDDIRDMVLAAFGNASREDNRTLESVVKEYRLMASEDTISIECPRLPLNMTLSRVKKWMRSAAFRKSIIDNANSMGSILQDLFKFVETKVDEQIYPKVKKTTSVPATGMKSALLEVWLDYFSENDGEPLIQRALKKYTESWKNPYQETVKKLQKSDKGKMYLERFTRCAFLHVLQPEQYMQYSFCFDTAQKDAFEEELYDAPADTEPNDAVLLWPAYINVETGAVVDKGLVIKLT